TLPHIEVGDVWQEIWRVGGDFKDLWQDPRREVQLVVAIFIGHHGGIEGAIKPVEIEISAG
ncbi:MAG TPA: hypothetical protein DEH25_03820, partial [Chloroflexi bacterium]|nr:hypothetical protein [Chloroflexota bacterium]